MLAKLTTKNQLTLPREIVKEFTGIEYFDAAVRDGRIVLVPVRIQPLDANLAGIRKKMEKLGITPSDVTEAVRWARRNEK
ncbi:MAG: AbrB family transcriptional regulator [Syntrophobacterales bacterium CG23_combo_of_CG06-09_8_20_14_all_48_27]|nr:MAG: AbrB family transcriptional regulator [Syntrophobacterales bacterium CG23_combo_of_CG06-09_8_20_14_all_48_27]